MAERFTVNAKICKIKKDHEGNISDVMLENGTVLPINHAILQAKEGLIDGVIAIRGKDGGEFLRTDPNSYPVDNLLDLPTFR
ncbi:MAG: hypothetical protein K0Q48_2077 [Bacillota bacterium]|jgi:hypothetical protein|nr:hypothetical protein [Bacillota bacterium]